jgi:WD40 repeat protein
VKDKWPTSNAPYGGVLLFFVPNQDTLAIGDPSMRGDNTFNFSFWSLATKSQVIAYPNMGNAIKFSPNGSEFASNGFNSATLWSTNHIRPLRKLALSGAITFAPDGLALASPSRKDRAILIIERATGEERFRCQGSPDELISSATYSPDGRLLASCSNKRFCFWDARSGKLLYEAVINQDVFTLEFSPDGRFLATTGNDGTIMLWSADNYRASKSPTRNLSAEELNQAWLQLNSSEASDGFKGMQTLLQSPEQAVALIKEKVKPAKLPSDQQIRQWIEDLDTKSFAARDVANKNLEELGEAISPALEKALQSKPSPEVRDRITRLLENADNGRAKEVGNLRAVEVLEWIGNQEAKKVLAILSQGSEAAYLTKAARNALDLFKHWNP